MAMIPTNPLGIAVGEPSPTGPTGPAENPRRGWGPRRRWGMHFPGMQMQQSNQGSLDAPGQRPTNPAALLGLKRSL